MHQTLKASLIQLGVEILLTLLIVCASLSSSFVEIYYLNGLYRPLSICLRYISNLFPFAIGDFLYGLLICFTVYLIIKAIDKVWKREMPGYVIPIKAINFLLLLFITFKLFWGLNYDRPPVAKQLGIKDQKYNVEQLVALTNYFLVKLNTLKPNIDKAKLRPKYYSIHELKNETTTVYHQLASKNDVFTYPAATVKSCLLNGLTTKSGIEGYYNPLSGEANVNMDLPVFVLPFTISHEVAHQTGIAKEDEANLIGYLVATNSKDLNFKYSAYYSMFRSMLFELRFKSPDDYELIIDQLDESVRKDFDAENEFWAKNNSSMSKYMGTAFDKILKFNRQKKGIKSYQDIVLWLYNYHKTEL